MGALTCKDCRHWQPPLPEDERAYRAFLAGYGRRVKHPSGYCRHFQHRPGETTRSAETRAHQPACRNFAARPTPPAEPLPGIGTPHPDAWSTVWRGNGVAWQGPERHLPSRFRDPDERQIGLGL